jgi:hypothetical protein
MVRHHSGPLSSGQVRGEEAFLKTTVCGVHSDEGFFSGKLTVRKQTPQRRPLPLYCLW